MKDEQLECHIIGSMINDASCLSIGLELIFAEDLFRSRSIQIIFKELSEMNLRGVPVDVFSVKRNLQLTNTWLSVEPIWDNLIDYTSEIQVFEYHIGILIDEYKLRVLNSVTEGIIAKINSKSSSSSDIINNALKELEGLMSSDRGIRIVSAGKVLLQVKEDVQKAQRGEKKREGIECGFKYFGEDFIYEKGDLIILAGRPSMGKSAFMIQLIKNLVIDQQVPCGLISLEMTQKENMHRLLSNVMDINSGIIKHGFDYHKGEVQRFYNISNQYSTMPLYINEDYDIDIVSLKAKIVYFARVLKCKVIFIDHLGLISISKLQKDLRLSTNDALGHVTRMLKILAAKEGISIIPLSQLSRKVEERTPPRPMLSDLKDSGNIEADASKVLLMFRPEYYSQRNGEKPFDSFGRDMTGITEVMIAKNRNGKVGAYYFDTKLQSSLYIEDEEFNEERPILSAQNRNKK